MARRHDGAGTGIPHGTREIAIVDRRKHLMEALRTDHGIADFGRRIETLAKDISTETDETSHSWIALRHHHTEMNDAYLTNWADAFDSPPPNRPIDAEGAARRITAHILGSGMHKSRACTRTASTDGCVTFSPSPQR
jgi:hypothetical protein